jgi:hypothetical protein
VLFRNAWRKNNQNKVVNFSFVEYESGILYNVGIMSHQAAVSAPLSRPKIHRFPAAASRPSKFAFHPLLWRTGVAIGAFAVVIAMIAHLMTLSSSGNLSLAGTLSAASMPVANAMAAVEPIEKQNGNTIVISGKSGTIVGQMARIPAQNEQITEVKPVTEVDNRGGRDLLSIIGKY